VIVSTPQDIALIDAAAGCGCSRETRCRFGPGENMSVLLLPELRHRADIFGHGGPDRGERLGTDVSWARSAGVIFAWPRDAGTPGLPRWRQRAMRQKRMACWPALVWEQADRREAARKRGQPQCHVEHLPTGPRAPPAFEQRDADAPVNKWKPAGRYSHWHDRSLAGPP